MSIWNISPGGQDFALAQQIAQDHDIATERCKQQIGKTSVNDLMELLSRARSEANSNDKAGLDKLLSALDDNIDEAAEYLS